MCMHLTLGVHNNKLGKFTHLRNKTKLSEGCLYIIMLYNIICVVSWVMHKEAINSNIR